MLGVPARYGMSYALSRFSIAKFATTPGVGS
jgi:hypothetical protein